MTEDPYQYLEEVESETSLNFAKEANEKSLSSLGDPSTKESSSYERILEVLESKDRIAYATKFGSDENNENDILMNFWKDDKHIKGIWRKTTLSSYSNDDEETIWETVLDLDEIGEKEGISWVWKGYSPLRRSFDSEEANEVTRCLLKLSNGGSDAITVREFDLISKSFLPSESAFNVEKEAKTRISYKHRNTTLIGTEVPGSEDDLTESGYPRTVREWKRGTKLEDAPIVHEGKKTDVSVGAFLSDQRHRPGGSIYYVKYRTLTFYTSLYEFATLTYDELVNDVDISNRFKKLPIQDDAEVDIFGPYLFISLRSDWKISDAVTYNKGSLLSISYEEFKDVSDPINCAFKVIFEPTDSTALETYTCTKNYLILSIMDNVKNKLQFWKLEENSDLTLIPTSNNTDEQIRDISCSAYDSTLNDLLWITISSYTIPTTLFLGDASLIETSSSSSDNQDVFITKKIKSLPPQYDSNNIVTEQRFATSKDGTKVPYFLIYNPTLSKGHNKTPTLLYGYGGFEISLTPRYIASNGLSWLEKGGAFVEANIRGGGEYGPSWHQAALKQNRNKAYEDFAAVAEHLIGSGLCTSKTLGIKGGSNGGLLVGNMYTTYPELFGGVVCSVPLLDMKRYSKLLAGASWMAEYGDPDDPEQWEFLKNYSPYHNIDVEKKSSYPPILFTTSTRDDRVHPAHARKMVKRLWDLSMENVYYYENIEGGHGGAANLKQSAFMTSLANDFLWDVLSSNN